MSNSTPRLTRCAVYTRKSTEHNLDLAFTSLDAQREACEAYIRSQAGEGWRPVPGRYDDGGLSGASLDAVRPPRSIRQGQFAPADSVKVWWVANRFRPTSVRHPPEPHPG